MLARRNLLAAAPLTALGIALTTTPARQDSLDSPLDSGNANRYAYAACDPVNNFDLTGYKTDVEWGMCILSTIGFIGATLTLAGALAAAPETAGATLVAAGASITALGTLGVAVLSCLGD